MSMKKEDEIVVGEESSEDEQEASNGEQLLRVLLRAGLSKRTAESVAADYTLQDFLDMAAKPQRMEDWLESRDGFMLSKHQRMKVASTLSDERVSDAVASRSFLHEHAATVPACADHLSC